MAYLAEERSEILTICRPDKRDEITGFSLAVVATLKNEHSSDRRDDVTALQACVVHDGLRVSPSLQNVRRRLHDRYAAIPFAERRSMRGALPRDDKEPSEPPHY